MKILLVNKYFFLKGGSEAVFFDSAKLLKDRNHEVIYFSMKHPKNYDSSSSEYFVSKVDFNERAQFSQKIKIAGKILYSLEAKRKMDKLIVKERPDIVHLHNIYHQISPSILHTLKKYNVPTVMTLHDYKIVCPVYTMFRQEGVCEKCLGGKYYWCLLKRCTEGSLMGSFLNTLEMYFHHNILNIYDGVNFYISPSKFLKNKLAEASFKGNVVYLPNFIWIENFVPSYTWSERSIIYFGRLSYEKGLFTLLSALKGLDVKCKIIGDGPLKESLERKAEKESLTNISFLSHKPRQELIRILQRALFVVLPSEWYENNPRAIFEAFAIGKPVVGSRIGGIPELIKEFKTGLTFKPGDANDLKEKILYLWNHPEKITGMGKKARMFVEENFNPDKHYQGLMKIYQQTMETKK